MRACQVKEQSNVNDLRIFINEWDKWTRVF